MTIKVEQLSGDNHYKIYDKSNDTVYLQSYNKIIVKIEMATKTVYLDRTYYNWSKTTSKYRNLFLGVSNKTFKDKLENGGYFLTDLN